MQRFVVPLLLVFGCAGPHVARRAPEPPRIAAGDAEHLDLTFTGVGGAELYGQAWRPRGTVRGALVIHHGLADHGARYAGLATQLVAGGYAVYALDMRGHAHSAGVRVGIDTIDQLLGDLDAFVALVRQREPGVPLALFGHSLGGLATALYAIERQPEVAGVILSAPGIAFDAPPLQVGAIRFIAGLAPNAPVLATPFEHFSHSADVIADMHRDPLIFQRSGPARTARAGIEGVARVWAHPERLVAPLLALAGSADRIVAPTGSRDLVGRAGAKDRTLRIYDGLGHDLLHEPDGAAERVAADIRTWLDAHTGGPPATFPPAPPLRDRGASMVAIDLGARGEHASGADGAYAELRVRLGRGRPLGYAAGLDVRGGYLDGGRLEADAFVAGLALRARSGASVALVGGIGIGGIRGIGATHLASELALELPLGPLHAFARAGAGWRLSGATYAERAVGPADEATATVGVRLGADRRYWSTVTAGAGPYLGVTYRNFGGAELYGLVLGGQLWGGS